MTITSFFFEGDITLRVFERNGAPWFVTTDACRALGIANPSQAIQCLDDDEKGICSTDTLGGRQEMLVISESGLFTLILRSRDAVKQGTLPHRFRRWVTSEVLPALRSKGRYQMLALDGACAQPETLKVRLVTEARCTFGTRAAGELWFALGLPTVAAMRASFAQLDLFIPQPTKSTDATLSAV